MTYHGIFDKSTATGAISGTRTAYYSGHMNSPPVYMPIIPGHMKSPPVCMPTIPGHMKSPLVCMPTIPGHMKSPPVCMPFMLLNLYFSV